MRYIKKWLSWKNDIMKYEAGVEKQAQAKANEAINRMITNHNQATGLLIDRHDKVIKVKNNELAAELTNVREHERVKYQAIIREREEEIDRLQAKVRDNRTLYESLRTRESLLNDIAQRMQDAYERAGIRVNEGYSMALTASKDVEEMNRKLVKHDARIAEGIKE